MPEDNTYLLYGPAGVAITVYARLLWVSILVAELLMAEIEEWKLSISTA